MRHPLSVLLCTLLLLGGCHSKQVRHLASDAALIKPGQTTAKEMQKYLGEPDGRREVAPGVSEYVYFENRPGIFGSMPVLGSMTGPAGYEMIVVTVSNDVVTNCEFRNFNQSDRKWREDFTWDQEIK
ncbi:MAG: hypothetical protein LBD10_14170 [Desulfobulbus sp.]|jgi:hypothetical protein|uniref:hypothetical protein n=1 Tax=Desulfobulbus sp. TaxID=895 RepID=UPI00284D15DE|nr:hypothetical protein [Desulfobulbus sp.]MDR2551336.1 hypothetical protein [Desulfobulbus sp.]